MDVCCKIEETTPTYQVHRLEGLPPEGFVISNFVTEHEEEYLLRKVGGNLPSKQHPFKV